MLFDLLKAFDKTETSHKSDIFSPKEPIFVHDRATCSELGKPQKNAILSVGRNYFLLWKMV